MTTCEEPPEDRKPVPDMLRGAPGATWVEDRLLTVGALVEAVTTVKWNWIGEPAEVIVKT
jgi:hypothetical protein